MVEASDVQKKILRRAKSVDEYDLYRAGLEWDLTDPIVLESADDFKSAPRWQERLKPFQHQVINLITFCRRLPVTLLADDVGLGKTISAGLIISELASRSRISKVLVVCPKILGPQWQSELESKFDIPAKFVTGRELLTADFEEQGVVITTYNSARLYLDQIPDDRFEMLVLDEAHKLRNLYGVEKPPQVAKCFHAALQARRFRFVLMLTATPIHNRLWDLYSLVDLLTVGRGHQNPFGSPGMFARRFIADEREKARQLKQEAIEEFQSIVYGYMSRVRRGDAKLYFPDRRVERRQVEPTDAELTLIKTIAEPIQKMNTSRVRFVIDQGDPYDAAVTVRPSAGKIVDAPQQDLCTKSGRKVPSGCLEKCEITGAKALRHLLGKSELSGRIALPEHVEACSVTGKKVLTDELGVSDLTGRKVSISQLQRCEITAKQAEKDLFGKCSFSNSIVLRSELGRSEISGRPFRPDQGAVSAYSGKIGHEQEFISCSETSQLVANNEAERCQESSQLVQLGILLECEETGIRVRPSLLERCSDTGKLALKRLLVASSLSQVHILKSHAIKSAANLYCGQAEAVECAWSGEKYHPDDLGVCELTGLHIHQSFLGATSPFLIPLMELLNNYNVPTTETRFPILEEALALKLNGTKCRIISGAISPTKATLAVCAESKSMLGLKSRTLGFVFRPDKKEVIGNVAEGKRTKQGWVRTLIPRL